MTRKILLSIALTALLAVRTASAALTFSTQYLSFDDTNGDGTLSCGEPVTIGVFYQTDSPNPSVDPTELHGFITAPESGSQGISFLPGSVTQDYGFSTGCFGSVLEGNNSSDTRARIEVTCSQDPTVLPGGATLLMKYKAAYTAATFAQFTHTAKFAFDLRPSGPDDHLTATQTRSTSSTCSAPPPTVTIAKTSNGPAIPGQSHIYTLTVANQSALPLGGFYAGEPVPANTTFDPANSSPGWVCDTAGAPGASCSFLFSALPPGPSAIVFAVRIASAIPPGVSNITNTACVAESRTVYDCSSISDPFSSPPQIGVTKSITAGTPAVPGGSVAFNIAVTNTSSRGSTDVVATDTLPPGTTFNPAGSSPNWSCTPTSCTAHLGALNAGASTSISLVVSVPNPLPAGGASYVNTACGTPVEGGAPVCSTVTFSANGTPVLNLRKTLASGDGTPGSDLLYDLTLRNDGNQDATGVVVNETVPANTTAKLATSEPGWACSGGNCSFSLGSLAAGAQRTIRFVVTIANPLPAGVTSIVNSACPTAPTAVTACDTVTVQPRGKAILSVVKTILSGTPQTHAKALGGTLIRYSITVGNTGNRDAAAVTLREQIPPFTTYDASNSDPAWSCSATVAGSTCSLPVGALAAGASATKLFALRVVANPPANTDIRNTACADDPSGASGCGEVVTPPDSPTTISAQLSAQLDGDADSSGTVTPGDTLLYTALLTNTGTAPAGSVTWSIMAPPHTHLITGSVTTTAGSIGTGNQSGDSTIAVALGNLDPSATATVTYKVTIDPGLPVEVDQIVSQGSAMSTTAPAVLSDDPSTAATPDPTITPVVRPQAPPPPPQPTDVPTLGEVGLVILASALMVCALLLIRRSGTRA
jgi:uncharacterized repeat protein (TIGR01451 family)